MVYRIGDQRSGSLDASTGFIPKQQSTGFPVYDSMSSASPKQIQEKDAQKPGIFHNFVTWVKHSILRMKVEEKVEEVTKSAPASDQKNSHPQLPPPEDITMQQLNQCLKEMSEDLMKLQDIMHQEMVDETDPNRAEALYFLLTMKNILNGIKIKEMLIWDAKENTFQKINENKQLQAEKLNHGDYILECTKTNNTLGKVNFTVDIALVGMGAATVAAVIVTVATGGTATAAFAAVSAVLLPLEGVASLGRGISSGIQAWTRHKMERRKGEIGEVTFFIQLNSEKIRSGTEFMHTGQESIHNNYKMLSQLANGKMETSRTAASHIIN